jgi:hypothetical protein
VFLDAFQAEFDAEEPCEKHAGEQDPSASA